MLANAKAITTLPAEDLQRAIKFYTDTLGLKNATPEDLEGAAVFQTGDGSSIFIYQRGRSTAEHTALSFAVGDVRATVKALTERGVSFEQYDMGPIKTDEMGVAEMYGQESAWFIDPENNILAITSM